MEVQYSIPQKSLTKYKTLSCQSQIKKTKQLSKDYIILNCCQQLSCKTLLKWEVLIIQMINFQWSITRQQYIKILG